MICLERPPCLTEMLQYRLCFILADTFRHQREDIRHNGCPKFDIKRRFNSLFGNGGCDALGMTTFELPREKVLQPSFKKWHDSSQEEKPYSVTGEVETVAGTFTDWSGS